MSCTIMRRTLMATALSAATLAPFTASATTTAKNVILFIADGASWGAWDMASYYEYGAKDSQPYAGFDVKLGMTTLPSDGAGTEQRLYDADSAWNETAVAGQSTVNGSYTADFEGYEYLRTGYTDSAAAATAMASGSKTVNGRINYDADGNPLGFISQDMKAARKAVGVLSSVPISHATPAGFGAQNISRNNYTAITSQMIADGTVDVLVGGGNPLYDQNGDLRTDPLFNRISEDDWNALNSTGAPMTLVQDKADFEALADGTMTIEGRVIGLPTVGDTLQQGRTAGADLNEDVPTLETMTRAALNILGTDEDGLFMMVEGGAVDWAAHANQTDRIIEEMLDFNHSVQAAIDWVEANSSWDETLMIVTTDHGNSMPMGPNSSADAFEAIPNAGIGVLPDVVWHFNSHTVENALLWAQGAGSGMFADYLQGNDPYLTTQLGFNDGDYITNNALPMWMASAAGLAADTPPVPVPAAAWLFGSAFGALAIARRRQRKAA